MVAYDWGTGGIKKKKFGEDTEAPTNSFGGITDILKQTGLVNDNDISSLTKGVNRATGAVKDFLDPDSKLNLWNFTQPKSQRDKEAAYKQLNDSVVNYKGSFSDQLNAITDKINNREPFKYDLSGDTVFQNAKDQYLKNAKMGMTDAMAQAAALTGGYGSSYAQQAGYQAYQNNLDSLNDMIPGLYEAAMKRYQLEGDDLMNQYGVLSDRDNTEYQRLLGNRDFAYNDWANERDYQTALKQYQQQMMYQGLRDLVGDAKWGTEFGWGAGQDLFNNGMDIAKYGLDAGTSIYDRLYQAAQDKIANDFRQRQFDEDVRQYNENNRLNWAQFNEDNNRYREQRTDYINQQTYQRTPGSSSYADTIKSNYGIDVDNDGYSKTTGAYISADGRAYYDKGMTKEAPLGYTVEQIRALGLGDITPTQLQKLILNGTVSAVNGKLYLVDNKDNRKSGGGSKGTVKSQMTK